MKKIVFAGFLSGFGGAEKSMVMIASKLSELGHDVTIISLKNDERVYDINENVKYYFVKDRGKKKLLRILYRCIDLSKVLKVISPDIVISFWLQTAVFSVIISKWQGFKTIYSERGDPSDEEYNGKLGVIRSIAFKHLNGFVFQTKGAKEFFLNKISSRSTIIHNPVYIKYEDYEVTEERRKVIVNVGRLHEQKNQKLLIDAFSKISDNFEDYNLEIYGEGYLKIELEKQIRELGLKDRVLLKGTRKNLFDEIKDASLFVLSSNYEGMPNALMEAMGLGIPSISTDCSPGGARELIRNNENGIISKKNDVDDLSAKIKYMLSNPREAEKMGLRGKNICNTNAVSKIIEKWVVFIIKIIEGDNGYES